MRRLAIFLACIALAACGSEPANPPVNQEQAEESPAELAPDNAASNAVERNDAAPSPAPGTAAVPAPFRGTWAESQALCGDRSHHSRLVISERTLRFYESVMEVARVDEMGPREVNIVGTASGEGTTRPAEYHYSLNAAGDTLIDEAGGGMVRRRCEG